MAKKKLRKAAEDEEEEFAPPPFDEKGYYLGEVELARGTLVAALWGLLAALISTAVFVLSGSWHIGLAVGVLAALALKPMLDRLRIITRKMEGMKWPGLFFSYFMCWLAFWILLVNPPIMDLSPPQLVDRTPKHQELGGSLRLSIDVMENSGINAMTAELVLPPNGLTVTRDDFVQIDARLHQLELNYTETGVYGYIVRVEDGTGRTSSLERQTEIVASEPPVIDIIAIVNGTNLTLGTPIYIRVHDNAMISGFHYTLDASTEKHFLKPVRSYSNLKSDYLRDNVYLVKPTASDMRWSQGAHNLTLVAEDGAGNRASAGLSFTII
ncbi:MAG: hypothetical protein FJ149_01030 [Euryarchaeota archaeon]|nr:hypothetical protein [Euryarchaeota archaeon]